MSYDLLSFGRGTKAQSAAAENARMDAYNAQQASYQQSLFNRGGRMSGSNVPDYLQGQESAILPYYMGDTEKRMGQDLRKAYDSTSGLSYGDFQNAASRYTPLRRSAEDAVGSLYNGGLERKQLANFAPVADARVKFSRQSALDGLHKTLSSIESTQAMKGYNGDSYGARRLALDANTGASRMVAGANLANLDETRGIKNNILGQQFANWNVPNQMAGAERDQLSAPLTSYMSAQNARAQLFAPLRVGGQPFQFTPLPSSYTQPFGVNAMDGLGQIGSSVAQGISRGQQANAWNNYATSYGGNAYNPRSYFTNSDGGMAGGWGGGSNPGYAGGDGSMYSYGGGGGMTGGFDYGDAYTGGG